MIFSLKILKKFTSQDVIFGAVDILSTGSNILNIQLPLFR